MNFSQNFAVLVQYEKMNNEDFVYLFSSCFSQLFVFLAKRIFFFLLQMAIIVIYVYLYYNLFWFLIQAKSRFGGSPKLFLVKPRSGSELGG